MKPFDPAEMKTLRTCPNIFEKQAREIEQLRNRGFTEEEFAKLRHQQNFEMATFNLILYIFKSKQDNELLGLESIGQTILTSCDKQQLDCDMLMLHPFTELELFKNHQINFTFKAIKKLDYLYENFIHSPIPIIVCPHSTIESVREFSSNCFGFLSGSDETIYVFKTELDYELILLEPFVAVNFGLIDPMSKIIQDGRMNTFYLGFFYRKRI